MRGASTYLTLEEARHADVFAEQPWANQATHICSGVPCSQNYPEPRYPHLTQQSMEKYSRPSTVPASLRCGGTWLWRAFWRLHCDPHSARLLVVPSVAVAGPTHPGQKKKKRKKRKKNQTRQVDVLVPECRPQVRGPLPQPKLGTAPKYPYRTTRQV